MQTIKVEKLFNYTKALTAKTKTLKDCIWGYLKKNNLELDTLTEEHRVYQTKVAFKLREHTQFFCYAVEYNNKSEDRLNMLLSEYDDYLLKWESILKHPILQNYKTKQLRVITELVDIIKKTIVEINNEKS